jgi:hypothetical protein
MAIPTYAEIDLAIPPRSRPNRSLTNALLKQFRDSIEAGQVTDEQIDRAVKAYLSANPPAPGKDAAPVSVDQIREQIFAYLQRNPPAAGKDGIDGTNGKDGRDGKDAPAVTDEQLANQVAAYLFLHPPASGKDGSNGKDGASASDAQVKAAVANYLTANPPPPGKDGTNGKDGANATDAQVSTAVTTYLKANPPAPGKDGLNGKDGINGTNGINGKDGAPGINSFSAPRALTVVLARAYQASDPTKAAIITVTLQAQSSVSISGASNNEGAITIGAANTVAAGTGATVATYKNNLSGSFVAGLNINNLQASTYTINLPAGWWFAVRQTSGTGLQVVSAFEQLI